MTMVLRRGVATLTAACLLSLCRTRSSEAFVVPTTGLTSRKIGLKHQSLSPIRPSHQRADSTACFASPVASVRHGISNAAGTLGVVLFRELKELSGIQKTLLGVFFLVGFALGRVQPFWKRYTSVLDISPSLFGPTAPILKGRAVSVSDGDTIRFLHTPTWFHPKSLQEGEKLSENALAVRVATIDTPETPKFGKPGQPFGKEAKAHLKEFLNNKNVNVRLLQKDQYGRGVAQVFVGQWPWNRKYVDEEMLNQGFAEVYQGSGAVYGPQGLDRYLELEQEARDNKVGIWSLEGRESAAEYKKRTK